jgi:hypothetical protein
VGPQQGRKVFTLQTLPAGDEPFGDSVGQAAGFSLAKPGWRPVLLPDQSKRPAISVVH